VSFGFAALLLTLFAHQMLVLLAQPRFYSAALAVGPLALGAVGLAASRITSLGIVLSGRSAYVTVVLALAGALNVGLNLALVPRWGFVGSAWATAVTYACVAVGQLGLSQRLLPVVTAEWRRVATISVVTALSVTAASLVESHSPPHSFVLRVGLLLAFPAALMLSNVVDQRERAVSMDVLRRVGSALAVKRH
jgi:O-antigen/teichoic acid export membrane protein